MVIPREYPVAPERGGKPADKANYVSFLKNLRRAFDASGSPSRLGLSITIVREIALALPRKSLSLISAIFLLVHAQFRHCFHRSYY